MKLALAIGYSGATLDVPIELIQHAERLGFDSVWTAEAYGSDAITPLAWIAAKTERIRLGTGIMQLAGRTPAMCAMQCMTVDALAGGDTVATLLPGVEFSTRSPYPDARRLLDAGVPLALATDCNPGTCASSSMPAMALPATSARACCARSAPR